MISDLQAKQNIAANVRRLRGSRSYGDIARACSTDEWRCYPATIQQVESAQHMPGAGLLARLAEALDTTADALLADPQISSRVAS